MKLNITAEEAEQLLRMRCQHPPNKRGADADISLPQDTDYSRSRNNTLLERANSCYDSLSDFRRRRQRAVNYYRGRQWSDTICVNGHTLTEEQYIAQQGRTPLKQNLIRPPLRNLIGQYRSNPLKPVVFARNRSNQRCAEMMSLALESVLEINNSSNRDARALEEFLISGCCIYRTAYSFDAERQHAIPKFRAVNPVRFFMNTEVEDVEGDDLDFIGEIADLSPEELIATYCHSYADEQRIRQIYQLDQQEGHPLSTLATQNLNTLSLLSNQLNGKCRVIEIWQRESAWQICCHDHLDGSYQLLPMQDQPKLEQENKRRANLSKQTGLDIPPLQFNQQFTTQWQCYHLSPYGDTLYQCTSPYQHGSHPFVFTFYPMVNGESWGLVEDLIDQQRMINRNIILFDFINGASAKGVLLVPEECIPDDYTIDDIAEEWSRYNGVIKIKAKAGAQIPQQISNNAIHTGLTEMLQLQMNLISDIGGVNGALQGKSPTAGTPSALYAQESQNSTVNTLDYIATFNHFITQRDKRMLQLIRQFYNSRQYISLAGDNYSKEAHDFDPELIRDVDFGNSIIQNTNTAAFRTQMDNTLLTLLNNHLIDLKTYLSNSSLPFADHLLNEIQKNEDNTPDKTAT